MLKNVEVMKKVKLGEIATVNAGQAAPKTFSLSGTPFIRAGHLEDLISGKGLDVLPKVTEEIARKNRLKKLPKGSILFAKSGMSAKKNRIYISEDDSYFVSHLAAILPSDNFDTNFLARYLNWYNPTNLILDDAYPSIRLEDINNLEIPLPDLTSQQKIAVILDKANDLCQYNRELIEKYDALTQSLFLEMFGDPVRNEKGWNQKNLKHGIFKINSGLSLSGEEREIKKDEIAVLKISAVTTGVFDNKEYKVVDKSLIKKELIYPRKGDLLFSRANTKEKVGAVAIVDKDYDYLFLPDKLWRIDTNNYLNKVFLKFLLSHDGFRYNIEKVATGTSGSMLNISMPKLLKIQAPFPPINFQNQFAERIQAIEAQKQQAQEILAKSEALFNSLMQRAFKGELN